ncbi:MAG: hypothetical protein M3354_03600 [Chloroflexota bacterium]|nr:hypothetical protein [Chloroflexota bacterium]
MTDRLAVAAITDGSAPITTGAADRHERFTLRHNGNQAYLTKTWAAACVSMAGYRSRPPANVGITPRRD